MNLNLNYPLANRGLIVVWSLIASMPYPGMVLHRLQFLAGLRRLGFDVWYVEETGVPLKDPKNYYTTQDYQISLNFLKKHMELIGLGDRWVFRPLGQTKECFGATDLTGLKKLYSEADAVINHTGAQTLLSHHSDINNLIYIETDPVVNQIAIAKDEFWTTELEVHDYLFTYAGNIGSNDCRIPIKKVKWIPIRPAICVDWWITELNNNSDSYLTTIATWEHNVEAKDVIWNGKSLRWSKHYEFLNYINIPKKSKLPLEIAIAGITDEGLESLKNNGWHIIPANTLSDIGKYRDYIQKSLGEFTVAKEQYVASRSGWFSDRSATYLASGRPVITQDTGFGNTLPTGEGLFAFTNMEEAIAAINAINSNYKKHCTAAKDIAYEYFEAKKVLERLITDIGLS